MTDPALESSFNEAKILLLESKVSGLESEKQQLTSDNQDLSLRLSILQSELEHRDQHIKMLNQSIYGKKSEKTASVLEQMSFAFDEAGEFADDASNDLAPEEDKEQDDEFEEITYKGKKNAGRKALPENLPREDIIHDLPEEEKICDCGCELTKIGEDTSEELHLQLYYQLDVIFAINMLVRKAAVI